MKKLFLMMAMLLATSFTAFADDNNSNNVNMVEAYTINVKINSLVRYLELSDDQKESVESVHKVFSESLRYAAVMDNENRNALIKNVIDYDLKNMKYILTKEQYKKYLKVLNATMVNRGIIK